MVVGAGAVVVGGNSVVVFVGDGTAAIVAEEDVAEPDAPEQAEATSASPLSHASDLREFTGRETVSCSDPFRGRGRQSWLPRWAGADLNPIPVALSPT